MGRKGRTGRRRREGGSEGGRKERKRKRERERKRKSRTKMVPALATPEPGPVESLMTYIALSTNLENHAAHMQKVSLPWFRAAQLSSRCPPLP
jgi:hypothetical protein